MEESKKKAIRTWISRQKEDLIFDLMKIVNVKSVSEQKLSEDEGAPFGKGCQKALTAVLERGSSMGLTAANYEGYAGSLSLQGDEVRHPEKVIGIWSHLDVVPAGEGWKYQPYESVYEDGLVIGRGSQDNKSAAVMGLYLLKGLKELEISLTHPAAVYFGCSEECGMQDLDYFLANYQAPGISLIADCGFPACYGEKGCMTLTIEAGKKSVFQNVEIEAGVAHNIIPGYARAKIFTETGTYEFEAEGIAGHSAFPEGSVNGIEKLLLQIFAEPQIPEEEKNTLRPFLGFLKTTDGMSAGINKKDDLLGDLTCCGTVLRFEEGIWRLDLDIRYPASVDPEWIIQKIGASAEAQGCMVKVKSHLPAFGLWKEHPVVKKLTDIYNREEQTQLEAYSMAGGTYAAKLPRAIPFGISFSDKSRIKRKFQEGHGDYHQPDEAVEADQILEALYLYMISLIELDELWTEYENKKEPLWK